MVQPPYLLDDTRRQIVLNAIREVCENRDWTLFAAHVRSNHVHVVVGAGAPPEKVMNDFKSYCSRRLTEAGLETSQRRRWARHGSTQYLWKREEVLASIEYVTREQGEPMAVFEMNS